MCRNLQVIRCSDNCTAIPNFDQRDSDGDAWGDACDNNDDSDAFLDDGYDPGEIQGDHPCGVSGLWYPECDDNCRTVSNPDQADWDLDGIGDVCDDSDGDRIVDAVDNCPTVPNRDQRDTDGDRVGDACDKDDDDDSVLDGVDNCPVVFNPEQADSDPVWKTNRWIYDGYGDACDLCPQEFGYDNTDIDGDGKGGSCDDDDDNDGVRDELDNCPADFNPGQYDLDRDGAGMECDEDDTEWVYNRSYQVPVQFSPAQPLRIPLPDYCLSCGGGEAGPGYLQRVNVTLTGDFYAQVTDSSGAVLDNTHLSAASYRSQQLRVQPALYSFGASAGGPLGVALGGDLAPDETRYYLELYPPPGTSPTETFTMTLRFTEGTAVSHAMLLPLVLRGWRSSP